MGMRVTNSSTLRSMNQSINDVHSRLNKSMAKVSSGKAYETAAENPLAYYQGKKIDHEYLGIESKLTLVNDIRGRLDEQSSGALSIQRILAYAKGKVNGVINDTQNETSVDTIRSDLLEQQHSIVNDLNRQYQDFFVFGGSDNETPPFSLSEDGTEFTFTHKFPGDAQATEMVMTLEDQGDGSYSYKFSGTGGSDEDLDEDAVLSSMLSAMKEQGRVDIGHGSINDKSTLLDTFYNGLNVLTGLDSDALRAMDDGDAKAMIKERMNQSAMGLIGQASLTMKDVVENGGSKDPLSDLMDNMTEAEHVIGTVYSDIGNKYKLTENVETKLNEKSDALTEQYTDLLGADPYESIMEMYSHKYAYDAAQRVSAQLMQSSIFDFMR